jgi:hypothetical protein
VSDLMKEANIGQPACNKAREARGGAGSGLLAEGLDELVLDADDLHVRDGLARSPRIEVALLKRVDEGVLGRVPRLADRAGVLRRLDRVDLVLLLALADAGILVGFKLLDLVTCLIRRGKASEQPESCQIQHAKHYLNQVDSAESVVGLDIFCQNYDAIADDVSSGSVERSCVDHALALKLTHDSLCASA